MKTRTGTMENGDTWLDDEFTEPLQIGHRGDALELLDVLISADSINNKNVALEALKDAIERGIV